MKKVFVSMVVLIAVMFSFSSFAAETKKQAVGVSRDVLEGQLNINTATEVELQMLPGVGKKKAEAIVAYRKSHGNFKSVDELDKVKGIGKSKLKAMRPYCMLEGKSTLKVVK